jgi:hypothetical protein
MAATPPLQSHLTASVFAAVDFPIVVCSFGVERLSNLARFPRLVVVGSFFRARPLRRGAPVAFEYDAPYPDGNWASRTRVPPGTIVGPVLQIRFVVINGIEGIAVMVRSHNGSGELVWINVSSGRVQYMHMCLENYGKGKGQGKGKDGGKAF